MVQMSEQLLAHNQVPRRIGLFSVSFVFANCLIQSLRRSKERMDFHDFHSGGSYYAMSPSLGVSFVVMSSGLN